MEQVGWLQIEKQKSSETEMGEDSDRKRKPERLKRRHKKTEVQLRWGDYRVTIREAGRVRSFFKLCFTDFFLVCSILLYAFTVRNAVSCRMNLPSNPSHKD